MKRATWTFYDLATGEIRSRTFAGNETLLAANTPDGCGAIEGIYDRLSQRVDLATTAAVDYQPPAPDDDHEWRENAVNDRPRWVKKREVVEREHKAEAARRAITEVEAIAQPRAVRDALLTLLPDGPEKTRLKAIEDAIAERRKDL